MRREYHKRIGGMLLALLLVLTFAYSAAGDVFNGEHRSRVLEKARALQVPFIENLGQVGDESRGQATGDRRVKYYAKTFGGTVFITEDGRIIYSLLGNDGKGWAIEERFVGSAIADVKGEEESVTRVSYFKGNDPEKWRSGVATYNLVSLGEIYDGIELKLRAYGNNMEKLFHVKPGADPSSIRVKMKGAQRLSVNGEGELEVETGPGAVKFTKPMAYQEQEGRKNYILVAYAVKELALSHALSEANGVTERNEYWFEVGEYDRSKELVIDPLLASTFLGGGDSDVGYSIALDGNGNVYVAGSTWSSDFPTTAGAYDAAYNGTYDSDVFVARLSGDLASLLASTFIGGSSYDLGYSIALDTSGNIYITGYTYSSDFPTASGAYDTTHNGYYDVFVARLDGNLSSLLASTFIGGTYYDYGYSIALDTSGNIYITGYTYSSDFPTASGAYDITYNGYYDVFVARLDADLSSLRASTFIGGTSYDYGYSIAVDGSGDVYVAGSTQSSDFPTTAGAYDTTYNGDYEAFVARLDGELKSLPASTFIGGGSDDYGYSIALDASGNVYVAGITWSSDFPTTAGAYAITYNGSDDVFVASLDADLSSLLSSTFIGGSSGDWANSIALDGSGNVYVAGYTQSSDFPTTAGAYDTTHNGYYDVFVARLDGELKSLLAATFIGGGSDDYGYSIALDGSGDVYVAGRTDSLNFPTAAGAYDATFNGGGDVFVPRLDAGLCSSPGDADGSGAVDILDVIKALRVALGVEGKPLGLCAADLDANGTIDILDAIKIVRIVAGLE